MVKCGGQELKPEWVSIAGRTLRASPSKTTLVLVCEVEMGLVESALSCVAVTGYFWLSGYQSVLVGRELWTKGTSDSRGAC